MKRNACVFAIAAMIAGVCYGHTWVCQWTPEGWTACLGAHYTKGHIEDEPLCGVVFSLDTQAREKPEDYKQVLRAKWIGDVLGEERADGMVPGSGGLWHSLAFQRMQAIAAEVEGPPSREDGPIAGAKVTADDKEVLVDKEGVITIPAVACTTEEDSSGAILYMKSVSGGMQMHVCRLGADTGKASFKCTVGVPKAGKYELTAQVVTIHNGVGLSLSVNSSASAVDMTMPYTVGMWETCKAVELDLVKGRNTLAFTGKAGSDGVTIKDFRLTPVK